MVSAPDVARSILLMPYLGFTLPVGAGSDGFNSSPRFGGLLGWHVTRHLSLNAECDVDYVRGSQESGPVAVGVTSSRRSFWGGFFDPPRHYLDFALSPLVSLRSNQVVLGPKIGWFLNRGSSDAGPPASGSGMLLGFNLGLFLPWRGVSVGGLLTGSFRVLTAMTDSGAHYTLGLLAAVLL